jgi:hypothetical protein
MPMDMTFEQETGMLKNEILETRHLRDIAVITARLACL